MALTLSGMRAELRAQLGYYTWNEVASCACQIVRKFGLPGTRQIMEDLQEVLEVIGTTREMIGMIQSYLNMAMSLAQQIYGLQFIRPLILSQTTQVDLCPILNRIMNNLMNQGIDYVMQQNMSQWFKEKADLIGAYNNQANSYINDAIKYIDLVLKMIPLMEDCALEKVPDTKTYEDLLKGAEAVSKGTVEPFKPSLNIVPRVQMIYAESVEQMWTICEEEGKIVVRSYNTSDVLLGTYEVADGAYPYANADGAGVTIFYNVKNGNDYENKSVVILFDQLGNEEQYTYNDNYTYAGKTKDGYNYQWYNFFLSQVDKIWGFYIDNSKIVDIGSGIYYGICVWGDYRSYWDCLISMNGSIDYIRISGGNVVKYVNVVKGRYPLYFRNDDLESDIMVFSDGNNCFAMITEDWLNFTYPIPIEKFEPLWDSYHTVGNGTREITLEEYIKYQTNAIENEIGYSEGLLQEPYVDF